MRRLLLASVIVCSTSAMTLGAQGPGGRRPVPGPMPAPGEPGAGAGGGGGAVNNPAEFLLAHTGELKLTDAQVTRLAAIARRGADRRQALRTRLDSLRPERIRGERPDSAARERMRQRFEQMRPAMERLREQSQADRRDAIAVLTPDQQAQAWERIAQAGRGGRAGFRGGVGGQGRLRMQGRGLRGQGFAPRRVGPPNSDDAGAPGERRRLAPRPRPEVQD